MRSRASCLEEGQEGVVEVEGPAIIVVGAAGKAHPAVVLAVCKAVAHLAQHVIPELLVVLEREVLAAVAVVPVAHGQLGVLALEDAPELVKIRPDAGVGAYPTKEIQAVHHGAVYAGHGSARKTRKGPVVPACRKACVRDVAGRVRGIGGLHQRNHALT